MGTNPVWGNLDRALKLIEFYGKRGNTAPSVGFDESNPRLAQILDILAPVAKPLATVEAPQGIGERLVEQHAPYLPPETKSSYAEKIQRIPDTGAGIATEMTSPINIASTVAGGAAGMAAKGTLGALVRGAGASSLAPPALESMQEMNPEGIATAIIPLAIFARNPQTAARYPQKLRESVADYLNSIPPYKSYGQFWHGAREMGEGAQFPGQPTRVPWGTMPEAQFIMKAATDYTQGGDPQRYLKYASRNILQGENIVRIDLRDAEQRFAFYKKAQALIDTVRDSQPRDIKLYRGLSRPPKYDASPFDKARTADYDALKSAEIGDIIQVNELGSFSPSQAKALAFKRSSSVDNDEVLLETRGPVKSLLVSPLGSFTNEGETISFGKFRVVAIRENPASDWAASRIEKTPHKERRVGVSTWEQPAKYEYFPQRYEYMIKEGLKTDEVNYSRALPVGGRILVIEAVEQ